MLLLVGGSILTLAAAAEDAGDRAQAQRVVQRVLESERSGVEVPWRNAATGHGGIVVAERTLYPTADRPCRDYVRTLRQPGGATVEVQGTGCRLEGGRWQLTEDAPTEVRPRTAAASPSRARPQPAPAAGPTAPEPPAPTPASTESDKKPVVIDYTMPAKTEL